MRGRFGWRPVGITVLLALAATVALAEWIVDGDRFPPASGGSSGGSTPVNRTYPVLLLELGGQWTDFELKASTNNFESLVYYVQSSRTNAFEDDAGVAVYFTDDSAMDTRVWRRSALATAIGDQLEDPVNGEVGTVLVVPSHSGVASWQEWMSEGNEQLVWSYVRFDGIDLEKNASGTQPKWNMVFPLQWREARFAP